nr:MAG TPA: helix-turn-helix domain protein [Caudoviricetes sp.]
MRNRIGLGMFDVMPRRIRWIFHIAERTIYRIIDKFSSKVDI